ncbi:MAG: class I SAM-dependent methyltransferase [Akkermansiaceae bacterium]|jgi:hypothetical protein|nr:class I SAM-dependent methyltransferase [Akkermansiaceae bacterium]
MNTKREVVYSATHRAEIEDYPIGDVDRDLVFLRLFEEARQYTMTSKEVMFSTYQAARYVAQRGIKGDVVECGVWRGGSSLLAALTMREFASVAPRPWFEFNLGKHRRFWMYDTFEGMTPPSSRDVDVDGVEASHYIKTYAEDGKWCYADQFDVEQIFRSRGFGERDFKLVKGDVVETLKMETPKTISLLRLDTDWYESTKVELEVLYPLLSKGGVLIIDDYGHWEGSREAVDEFFGRNPSILLHRVSYAVRVGIKI